MLASIKIEQNISCESVCKTIQKTLEQYSKNNDISDSLIVIDIQKMTDDNSLVPKLEYKTIEP